MEIYDGIQWCARSFGQLQDALSRNNGGSALTSFMTVDELTEQYTRFRIWVRETSIEQLFRKEGPPVLLDEDKPLQGLVKEILASLDRILKDGLAAVREAPPTGMITGQKSRLDPDSASRPDLDTDSGLDRESDSGSDLGPDFLCDNIRRQIQLLNDLCPLLRDYVTAGLQYGEKVQPHSSTAPHTLQVESQRDDQTEQERLHTKKARIKALAEEWKLSSTIFQSRWLWNRLAQAVIKREEMILERMRNRNLHGDYSVQYYEHDAASHLGSIALPFLVGANLDQLETYPCLYCQRGLHLEEIRNKSSRRSHILKDISPYVCTFEHCHTPETLYASQDEWKHHEAQHMRMYTCREHGCTSLFKLKEGLSSHFKDKHNISFVDEDELDLILELSYRPASHLPPHKSCLFCDSRPSYLEGGLRQHMAYHLEDIALSMLCESHGSESEFAGPSSALRELAIDPSQLVPGRKEHRNDDEFDNVRSISANNDEGWVTFGSIHLGHMVQIRESSSSLTLRLLFSIRNPWQKGSVSSTVPMRSSAYMGRELDGRESLGVYRPNIFVDDRRGYPAGYIRDIDRDSPGRSRWLDPYLSMGIAPSSSLGPDLSRYQTNVYGGNLRGIDGENWWQGYSWVEAMEDNNELKNKDGDATHNDQASQVNGS